MKIKKDPPWRERHKFKSSFEPLTGDLDVDMLIIGGGIAGVATAFELSKTSQSIALIEKETIASGATNHTTAFFAQIIDTDLSDLVDMFGKRGAYDIWNSGEAAIDLIEDNIKKEKISCSFKRCSYYEFALTAQDNEKLEQEADIAKRLGFKVLFKQDKALKFNPYGYLEIKNQAKFSPLEYIDGLLPRLAKKGVQIFEKTEALDIKEKDLVEVKTKNGVIRAKKVFVLTYAPFVNKWEHYFKAAYYQDFMMELKIPKNSIKEALFADTNNPYTYFRIDSDQGFDRMIIGGLTHRVQVPLDPKKGYNALEKWVRTLFPQLKYTIIRKWSGRLIETDDGIAYIGKLTGFKNVYVGTGFSGNGMTYSHIAAMIFQDLVLGRKNAWAKLYDAQRIPKIKSLIKKGRDYAGTLIGGVNKNISQDATV